MSFLITGLGNIGPEYDQTRHNIGFMVVDALAAKYNARFSSGRYATTAGFAFKGKPVFLVKPTTFMNLSGQAVRYWIQHHKILVANSLVITDDHAIPFGSLRMKPKGSHGGHNGLRDIEAKLETQDYPRLRFGIGDDFPKGQMARFVLGRFPSEQSALLPELIDKSVSMIECFIAEGIQSAMNQYNT